MYKNSMTQTWLKPGKTLSSIYCSFFRLIQIEVDAKKKKFLPKAEYQGGMKAMSDFILKNMVYPETALKDKIQGMVSLRLEIDFQGLVKEVKVKSGLRDDCNQEGIRLAKLLIFQVEKVHHIKISCFKNINIHFKLPPEITTTPQLQYTFSASVKSENNPSNNIYTYSIHLG